MQMINNSGLMLNQMNPANKIVKMRELYRQMGLNSFKRPCATFANFTFSDCSFWLEITY